MKPRDVLRAIDAAIAKGGHETPVLPTRRDTRPRRGRQLPLPLKGVEYTDPVITTDKLLEHEKMTGSFLVAVEGSKKSIQIIPDRPDTRRG